MTTETDEPLAITWSFDGKQLVLSDMRTDFCDHQTVWTTHPWVLVTERSRRIDPRRHLDDHADRGRLGGRAGARSAGVFTLTFEDGLVTVTDPGGELGYRANYRVFRDRIETSGGVDDLTATFAVDGDTLTLSDIESPGHRLRAVRGVGIAPVGAAIAATRVRVSGAALMRGPCSVPSP